MAPAIIPTTRSTNRQRTRLDRQIFEISLIANAFPDDIDEVTVYSGRAKSLSHPSIRWRTRSGNPSGAFRGKRIAEQDQLRGIAGPFNKLAGAPIDRSQTNPNEDSEEL